MPLTVARRPGRDGWWIAGTVTPAGAAHGVRIRRRAGSDDERLAREEAAALEREVIRSHHLGERPATHGWGEAVASYIAHDARSAGTLALLIRLTRHFRDTPLDRIGQAAVDDARREVLRPNAKPGTVLRNVVAPIKAVLHHAARRGWCAEPRLEAPRQPKGRTALLLPAEFEAVRAAILPRHRPLLTFLIGTGCRRGETLALDWRDVDLQGARARLWADTTKAGASRVAELPPAVVAALAGLPAREGRVFPQADPRAALRRAARVSQVPVKGLHDFRHAWASWHYLLKRDLILLKEAGGWESVELVTRYAHLMPTGQEEAVRRVWGLTPERHRLSVPPEKRRSSAA